MKAIVLSHDNYHPFAYHSALTYENLGPSNPFTFRVPYNNIYPQYIKDQLGSKVEIIQTGVNIRETILKLIEDIDDEEGIYGCIDDRYLIDINVETVEFLLNKAMNNKKINGLSFIVNKGMCIGNNGGNLGGYKFVKRINYQQIGPHQFMKCKCLRYLFESMPETLKRAKDMDYHVKHTIKLPFENMIVLDGKKHRENIFVVDESTRRGRIMYRCLKNFKKYGLEVPERFEIKYTKRDKKK